MWAQNSRQNGTQREDRDWVVVRREDGMQLMRYSAKPKAVAAALRFGADGSTYDVIPEARVAEPVTKSSVVPLRGG